MSQSANPPDVPSSLLTALVRRVVPTGTGTFANQEFWTTLAHIDLKARYRGSLLGPLWLTIATGVMVAGIGVLYGGLFGQDLADYLPYVAISIVVWTLVQGALNEAVVVFTGEGLVLRQVPVPATLFVTRLVYRNVLVLAHNALIIVVVLLIFPPAIDLTALWSLVGLAVVMANLWWCCFVLGVLGARFRDVGPIVASVLQIFFFLTPIIWKVDDLPERGFLVAANPVHHLIEIVRAPLLMDRVPWTSLGFAGLTAVIGLLIAFRLLSWSRTRLVYWL